MFVPLRKIAMICAVFFAMGQFAFAQNVTVFAAASLRDALDEVVAAYGAEIVISYGGSGQIARQVAQGAPADVVILANTAWMDWLVSGGLVDSAIRQDILGNSLVLVGPSGADPIAKIDADSLMERLAGGRMAIGQTLAVPAGIYGRQWLENIGAWDQLQPNLAETENVRAALALVARAETPLGIVYLTDARADPSVVIVHDVPGDLHDPIRYPLAVVKGKNTSQTVDFVQFLLSDTATEIFSAHGFATKGSLP